VVVVGTTFPAVVVVGGMLAGVVEAGGITPGEVVMVCGGTDSSLLVIVEGTPADVVVEAGG
jgi:hypothetical protein